MEKYILVEYLNSLNTVITQTFKSTKRIKLTCFDISNKYIIFGASSGGLYIFKREPCEFLKLIPSKEGSALKIVIAPNEKNIAVANSKGLVLILENFLDFNSNIFVHNQHESRTITVLIWHGNNVYCGDNMGKISVFSMSNLLTIFHTPSAVLMQLDSSIVQIDTYSNYLLISTQTRTYLCDTEKEQYKQIGKKLRDGCFGACFINIYNNIDSSDSNQSFKGIFKTIKEEEHFVTSLNNTNIRILCARPGARIWEVNFEATVLMTYQFRESLAQCPSDILYITDKTDEKLNISTFEGEDRVSPNFNFGKIYPIHNKFIFTYSAEGIYLFDPKISSLILWTNTIKNIKDIKIVNSVIYVWQDNLQIKIISLEILEDLILKILLNKQYYLCAELCVNYNEEVRSLVSNKSDKIHLIAVLKFKLIEIGATQLLEKIKPILDMLEEYNKGKIGGKKLTNGIVLVENAHRVQNLGDCNYLPESVQNFNSPASAKFDHDGNIGIKKINVTAETVDVVNNSQINLPPHKAPSCQEYSIQVDIEKNNLLSFYKQYQLNKTHRNAELTESTNLLEKTNLNHMLVVFKNFIKYVEELDKTDASMWCKEQFLKQVSRRIPDLEGLEQKTEEFLRETFLELNETSNFTCKCKIPLPKTHKNPLEYYKLGCRIFDHSENIDSILNIVPYLYKYKLTKIHDLNDLLSNLPLLIQFSDEELFEQFLCMFTYDTWDEIVKLFIKLRQGICLNCGETIDLEGIWSWTKLGMIMIKSIGSKNTSRLLKRYSADIPQGALELKFYQCCILSSTFNQPDLAVNYMEKVVNETASEKFEDLMGKFLHRKYLRHQLVTIKCDENTQVPKCVFCDIPLNESIIDEIKKCECGHNFHSLCLISNNGICNVCTST